MPRPVPSVESAAPIIEVWSRLPRLAHLVFTATPGPRSRTGWAGHGEARIESSHDPDGVRLHEHGLFTPQTTGTPVAFRNVYRWVNHSDRLSLWHERFGRDAAVWLFDLTATDTDELATVEAHLCGADRYDARLSLTTEGFELHWSITGPSKDETLVYRYHA